MACMVHRNGLPLLGENGAVRLSGYILANYSARAQAPRDAELRGGRGDGPVGLCSGLRGLRAAPSGGPDGGPGLA